MQTAHNRTQGTRRGGRSKPRKDFDAQAWAKQCEEKLEAAHAALDAGLKSLRTSDDWRTMLARMAQLGPLSISRLSFGNILLLQQQCPGVAHVATFNRWKAAGRSVRKGERALAILAPVLLPSRTKPEDTEGAESQDATPAKKRLRFRTLAVFAAEQTDGPELPRLVPPDLSAPEAFSGSVEKLRTLALQLPGAPVSSIALRARQLGDHPRAGGWYVPATREVVVITGETSRAHQFAVLCHELAHALLHPVGDHHSTPEREVEAESSAFVTCHALGLDTGSLAFPYVSSWARGANLLDMVAKSGERILRTARALLTALMPEAYRDTAHDEADGEPVAA